MMGFERYNKYLKNLVRDPNRPAINLANNTTTESSTRFRDFVKQPLYNLSQDQNHRCSLEGRSSVSVSNIPTQAVGDLRLMGSNILDENSCVKFPRANIMGTVFVAGEWGDYPRCGSVVTCVMGHDEPEGPRSLFARVLSFFSVIDDDNEGYALIEWFSEPVYLYEGNPLGARCKEDGSDLGRDYGNVLRITQIDPSDIMVEHDITDDSYIDQRFRL